MSKDNEIILAEDVVSVIQKIEKNVVPYFFKQGKIEKPTCKLCNSKHRTESEKMYADQKRKNFNEIKRMLETKHGVDISDVAVRNHLLYHYKMESDNESYQEYADNLQQWLSMQTNRNLSLKSRVAMLEKELFYFAQQSEELDTIERRKNAELMKKLAEVILVYENKIDEFVKEVKPINIIFNQLKVIVTEEMANVDNIKTKKVLSNVLSKLKDSVGDMLVDAD